MRFMIGKSAILLGLALGAGLPQAGRAAGPDLPSAATNPEIETTGSIDRSAASPSISPSLPLSDEQRGLIFLGVIHLPDVPVIERPAPEGLAVLPERFELQDLPAMVTRSVPLIRDHKFAKFEDRILVVRPNDRVVVVDIPLYRLVP